MGGAAKNRRTKKIKLLQNAQRSKTIYDTFNKQTKLETVSKQLKIILFCKFMVYRFFRLMYN
jgi:hypothetical protein